MGSPPLISVVDDDEGVRLALRDLLSINGWRVAVFTAGDAFLADPASSESTCIVSDLQMPRLDGLQMHRSLRLRGDDTPMVLISGFASAAFRARAARQGVCEVLEKPFEPADLLAAIARSIARG